MIAVALKGLLGRKVRALLTALAVVIGVMMVSGTLVITDTIQKAFDDIFGASYAQTDAVIAGKEIVKGSQSGAATVPESLLAKVRALPEVAAAGGTIAPTASNTAKIIGRDGKPVGSGDAPQFGLGNDASLPQFSALKLKTGEWPQGTGQVAIDADTAAAEHLRVGDTVAVSTLGTKRRYRVTGLATSAISTRSVAPPWRSGICPPRRRCSTRRAASTASRSPRRTAPHRSSSSARSSRWCPRAWRSRAPSSRPRRTPARPTSSSRPSATSCSALAPSRCSWARS
jgi:hypothetical protein